MCGTFTLAHVAAKLPWFWLGAHADRAGGVRLRRFVERAQALLARHPRYGGGVLMASAVLSVPPFHIAAIAAGLAKMDFVPFVTTCLAGRLLRFGVLVTAPQLLRPLFG